ncbi:hypothetical protein EBU94_07475 [bacterium]|nr:hypothetical protein [bacterium]
MSKKFIITEDEKKEIRNFYFNEQKHTKEDRKFCHAGNTKSLDEIMGDDETEDYIEGIQMRKNGVKGLTDKLELMKTLRMFPKISDGGEHLAHGIMSHMKSMKPYRFFDETKGDCSNAMDKIIELYKENEHGEELVKDIEKVYAHHHISPRAKEFLKHTLGMVKGH